MMIVMDTREERAMAQPVDGPDGGPADLFEPFRKLTADVVEATRSLLGAPGAGPPFTDHATQLASLYRSSVAPLRAMLDEQQELADRLSAGLEQLRVLTEEFAAWAEQHRRMVEHARALVQPMLEHSERLATFAETWAGRAQDR
jgi:methyl-accepting chemotaxis protein